MSLFYALSWILLLPLAAAALIIGFFRQKPLLAQAVSLGSALAVLGLSFWVILGLYTGPWDAALPWFSIGSLEFSVGYFLNPPALLLLGIVSFLGFWVQIFSIGYLHQDVSLGRYFAGISFFTFAMLGIVLARNLWMIFFFWEWVGLGSYALIAHYWHLPAAALASRKAFIFNRVGDLGFLLGILACYSHYGTVDIVDLTHQLNALDSAHSHAPVGVALLLMCGFLGKSAQFPLQVWLPDAMVGPTPVSALIHAATMVAAGIYLLCRIAFLFPPQAGQVVLYLGAAMALYAAFSALGQRDIKKILAYSTLSQLGYMACGFGLGFPGLALFHLSTHAFFKALLFLGAGTLIHSLGGIQDIYQMGGLGRRLPFVAASVSLGALCLLGFPFLSGHFSKEPILEAAFLAHKGLFSVLSMASFLTALYSGRLLWVVFLGEPRSSQARHPHAVGISLGLPLMVLSVGAALGGYLSLWPSVLSDVFAPDLQLLHSQAPLHAAAGIRHGLLALPWVLGLACSVFYYRASQGGKDALEFRFPQIYQCSEHAFYWDRAYDWIERVLLAPSAQILRLFEFGLISTFWVRGCAMLTFYLSSSARAIHQVYLRNLLYTLGGGVVLWLLLVYGFA